MEFFKNFDFKGVFRINWYFCSYRYCAITFPSIANTVRGGLQRPTEEDRGNDYLNSQSATPKTTTSNYCSDLTSL